MSPNTVNAPEPSAAVVELADQLRSGNRRALARTITMIESTRPDHRRNAEALLGLLLPHTGGAVRLGISGVPGVGKSTFIEAFGLEVIERGHKVAILAIDPSSPRTGGSILGDKTRMEELSREFDAFIRPSPSGGTLGGVARRTREAMLACEAAGFDVVIIETVGVGQSEVTVSEMVDMFLLLLVPGAGDELQGIKKGIVELADLVVVNKADGDLMPAADRAQREYANAMHLLRPASSNWSPQVLKCSAKDRRGIVDIWDTISRHRQIMERSGERAERRAGQARSWMWSEVTDTLTTQLRDHPGVQERLRNLEGAVSNGDITPTVAAQALLAIFIQK